MYTMKKLDLMYAYMSKEERDTFSKAMEILIQRQAEYKRKQETLLDNMGIRLKVENPKK